MTTESDAIDTVLVPGAHRTIRRLAADEGPFRGTLVTAGDSVAVKADAVDLGGWAGWAYAGCEHVAGPLDLVRRADGHDVLLPWCTETVDGFLGRRAAVDAPLGAGEISTLVVSLLRGVGELRDRRDLGRWWLTDGGRPVFVVGDGDDAREGAARLIERVQREGSDRMLGRLLTAVQAGLVEGVARPQMAPSQLERWEAELFEVAAPRALETTTHAPERVRGIERLREPERRGPVTRRAARNAALGSVDGGGAVARARGAVADAAERMRRAWTTWSAQRRRSSKSRERPGDAAPVPKRRKAIIAGAAAVAVVAGGLLWPGGATGEARAPSPAPVEASVAASSPADSSADPIADESAGSGPTDAPEEGVDAPESAAPSIGADDPVEAVPALLAQITGCLDDDDTVCESAVATGSTGAVGALRDVLSSPDAPSAELVDAYGDVAVIRLAPADSSGPGATRLMLVLVRMNEKWLVRDVYDVADQP